MPTAKRSPRKIEFFRNPGSRDPSFAISGR
jgi:hypothetical protein